MSAYTLAELASRFGLALQGDGATEIRGVGTLHGAAHGQISFLANPAYRKELAGSAASAVILRAEDAAAAPNACLISANPYADFARIATLFERLPAAAPGVHASAVVADDARIDPGASIGPLCFIGARARVAAGTVLGAGCVVGEDCSIGPGCRLAPRVTLVTRVTLGARVLIHSGAVIGADGFGFAFDQGQWVKVPQLGGVRIGDDCEIGANTTIDRGAIEDTVLEEDVRLDNQIQVGHNVVIGAHTAIAGCSAIAGSTHIGRYCLIAGGVGIAGHLTIGDRVKITAMSLVSRSLAGPGEYSSGTPLQDTRTWRRNAARFRQLDTIARRLKNLPKEQEP